MSRDSARLPNNPAKTEQNPNTRVLDSFSLAVSTMPAVLSAEPMAVEKILVVGDEEDLLELIGYNLGKEGYRVTCVASGEEAIREAKQALPDLVLLDLLLPSVDG